MSDLQILENAVAIAADQCDQTGECPLWHPDEAALYWTDIPRGKLHRLDPATGITQCVYVGRTVGGMTLQADGALALFRDQGNVVIFKDGDYRRTLIPSIPALKDTRFNDVIADPVGRVFAGTISTPDLKGQLYRIEPDGRYEVVLEDQGTPNGMAFSAPDAEGRRTFFYQDSRRASLFAFDYDETSGALSRQRLLRDARAAGDFQPDASEGECDGSEAPINLGRGDGLTIDAGGHLWSGRYEGGRVLQLAADGSPIASCALPTRDITSLCFAGENLTDLYVTSAGGAKRSGENDPAGALFRITGLKTGGVPEFRSRLGI